MKVEDCIVTVERRNVGGCIDLAFVFLRQFLGPLYLLTACFAGPSLFFVWSTGESMRHDDPQEGAHDVFDDVGNGHGGKIAFNQRRHTQHEARPTRQLNGICTVHTQRFCVT